MFYPCGYFLLMTKNTKDIDIEENKITISVRKGSIRKQKQKLKDY